MHSFLCTYSYLALVAALALLLEPAVLQPKNSRVVAASSVGGGGGGGAAAAAPEPFIIDIEHSFGGGIFERRASFVLSPPSGGFVEKNRQFTAVEELSSGVSSNFIKNVSLFKDLVRADGLYTIRVLRRNTADMCDSPSRLEEGDADVNRACVVKEGVGVDSGIATTSIPVCSLLMSLSGTKESKTVKFAKEEITIHMDLSDSDSKIISVFYGTKSNVLVTECNADNVPKDKLRINTVVKLGERAVADVLPQDVPGARPPFLANVRLKSDGSGDAVGSGAGGEKSQTFLSKYWYIVVIMVLFMLRGDPPAPEAAGAQGAAAPPK